MKITEPTVLLDMSERDYHTHHGSLSATGAKLLAPPIACPAKFRWQQDHPGDDDTEALRFGRVVHSIVLDKGCEVEVLPYDNLRSKAAKEAEAAALAEGKTPILPEKHEQAKQIAAAVKRDPIAGPLFTDGDAEVSLFWPDEETGVVRRARFDWLKHPVEGKRRIIADLKTARSSEPVAFGRSAADFGYAISAANYVDGAIACGLDPDPLFVFVAVEKEEPYVVSTFYADQDVIDLGRRLMRMALRTYARCMAENHWPGYLDGPAPLELPYYYTRNLEDLPA